MKKIPIEEANSRQLFTFCSIVLGLEVKEGMNNTQLRAKIEQAQPGTTEILVEEEPAEPAVEPPAATSDVRTFVGQSDPLPEVQAGGPVPISSHHSDPIVEIQIPSSPLPGGDQDVKVMVGGFQWLIQRNKWVPVPYRVYEALENAKETTYELVASDIPGVPAKKQRRENYSYPFNTRRFPTEEELARWQRAKAAAEAAKLKKAA